MADGSTAGWFPAFTLAFGFIASSVNEWLRDSRTARRDRERREAERRIQLLEQRASFEKETLMELQEAIARLIRANGAALHLDTMAERETGTWHRNLLPDALDTENLAAMVRTGILAVRVRDDAVRELVDALRNAAASGAVARSRQEAEALMQQMAELLNRLNARIGEVFRSLGTE